MRVQLPRCECSPQMRVQLPDVRAAHRHGCISPDVCAEPRCVCSPLAQVPTRLGMIFGVHSPGVKVLVLSRSGADQTPVFCPSTACFLFLLPREGKRGSILFGLSEHPVWRVFARKSSYISHPTKKQNQTRKRKSTGLVGVEKEQPSLVYGASVISKLKKSHRKNLPVISLVLKWCELEEKQKKAVKTGLKSCTV